MKINILGTNYEIRFVDYINEKSAGKTDYINKTIEIINDKKQALDIVLRHEIMHAVFFESGLLEYANDELLVDFFAIQYNKIKFLFEETAKEMFGK